MALPKEKSKKEKNYLKKRYLVYGEPKIGKSTILSRLGDENHKILFFTTEKGHDFLEIFKWQTKEGKDPTNWMDFKKCVLEMTTEKHDFSAICIDTTDNLFKWCASYICKKENIKHESDLGFGKGYTFIRDEFHSAINHISQNGIGIVFVSHSASGERDIQGRKYTYIDSTLGNTAKKVIHGLCDFIFYMHMSPEGHRVIATKGTESHNAGDRSGKLSEFIDMDAKVLKEQLLNACE